MVNEYISYQQKSFQWDGFLYSMARELEKTLNQEQRQNFMRNIGGRMAQGFPDLDMETLTDVEAVMNEVWKESGWGWVKFYEEEDVIKIEHYHSPLNIALGEDSQAWNIALLEGFYTAIFHQLGAPDTLTVRANKDDDKARLMVFYLS